MIRAMAGPVIDWYADHRRRQLERLWRDPTAVQERALRHLVATASGTEFGLAHGFEGIRSIADYQERVPVRDYPQMQPWLARAAAGEEGTTWPGRCRDWVKTSGTTSGDKLIPVYAHGISFLSLGQLVSPGHALAWRGPMATGALSRLVEADWGAA